jgi:hypothetical protein
MQFRQTAFDPIDGQALRQNDPNVNFANMDKNLAKEMASMRVHTEK